MSFEDKIPQHIETVEEKLKKLYQDRASIDWGSEGHECDCDYCDRQGDEWRDADPDAQKKADAIDAEIAGAKHSIESLKAHAAVHKIKLEDAKK